MRCFANCNAHGIGRTLRRLAPCMDCTHRTIKPWWKVSRKRRKPSSRRRSKGVTAGDEVPKIESKDRGVGFNLHPGPACTDTHVLLSGKISNSVAPNVCPRTACHLLATRAVIAIKGNPVHSQIPSEY